LTPDIGERPFSTLNADEKSKFSTPDVDKKQRGDVEGGGKQTAYGIFAQACWAQYDDEAGIAEFHIQCSDWWDNRAEKEREKFQSLAVRSCPLTSTRSGADEKSGFSMPSSRRLTSTRSDADDTTGRTRSPSSCPLTSTRSNVDEGHFSTLNSPPRPPRQ
jgi:hypothetical protein